MQRLEPNGKKMCARIEHTCRRGPRRFPVCTTLEAVSQSKVHIRKPLDKRVLESRAHPHTRVLIVYFLKVLNKLICFAATFVPSRWIFLRSTNVNSLKKEFAEQKVIFLFSLINLDVFDRDPGICKICFLLLFTCLFFFWRLVFGSLFIKKGSRRPMNFFHSCVSKRRQNFNNLLAVVEMEKF